MPQSQKKKPVSLGTLEQRIGFPLRVAQVAVFRDFEEAMGELGLTPAVFSALEIIKTNPGITQSKLAHAIYLDRSTVVPLLDKLEARGLITREASTTDRRNKHVSLTTEGARMHRDASKRASVHEARMASALSADELSTLFALLAKLAKKVQ